jgi:hypothetical protein
VEKVQRSLDAETHEALDKLTLKEMEGDQKGRHGQDGAGRPWQNKSRRIKKFD